MDKKQCERMFEQMQPPEAVVQRLQQRIHAEEAASLAEQQPNRSIQTLHTTTAPPPPKRIRCSWQKFSGGVVAAAFLLSMGTVIGYHLKHGEQVFVPSSESTPEASETPKTTQSLVLQYQGQNLREMAVVNPDRVEVQDTLGEGSLMGADGATTVSVYTSDLETRALSGDRGLTLVEMAPFGIIGAITPSTNPSCTVICNSICMLAGGNGVIFNPHPHAKRISAYAVDLVNRAILAAGGPENIVCTVKEPTRETSAKMVNDPSVRMLVATGGPGVVKMLLSSGKKAIGAGAGNPPVVVDDTADIPKAAKDIIDGCTFDNNLPCIAEKECFVMKNVADELIQSMLKNGAYLINAAQVKQLEDVVLVWSKPKKEGEQPKRVINKDWACIELSAKNDRLIWNSRKDVF